MLDTMSHNATMDQRQSSTKTKVISIVGDAFVDVYCYLHNDTPEVVVGGDARLIKPITTRAGGSGVNTATHLTSLIKHFSIDNETTIEVNCQSVVNENDAYGKLLIEHAKSQGFNLLNRRVSDYPSCFFDTEDELSCRGKSTGHCAVIVAKGERSFMTHLGCVEDYKGSHIMDESINTRNDLQHVHVAGYFNIPGFWDGELKEKLSEIKQRNKQITVSLVPQHDATEAWDGGILEVLEYVDFLILSECETKGIAKYDDSSNAQTFFEYAARYFHDNCPTTYVIVTLGSVGCVLLFNNKVNEVLTLEKDSIDPTGAGDAFAAGFIYGYLNYIAPEKKDEFVVSSHVLLESMLWGCASGGCCVMIDGASLPPERRVVEQVLQDIRAINVATSIKLLPLEDR